MSDTPASRLIARTMAMKPDLEWLLVDVAWRRSYLGWMAVAGLPYDYQSAFATLDALEQSMRDVLAALTDAERLLRSAEG